MPVFEDNSHSIGNTPLVRLNRIIQHSKAKAVYGKVEGRNPAFSVKCRIGASMVWDAEDTGTLKPGMHLVEPTSGNTGIALAYVCAARGYELTLVMPESMSLERRRVVAAFGAHLVLTPAGEGMSGAIKLANEIAAQDPAHWFMPHQFENPANPLIHEKTTGPEIWKDTNGEIDIFVAGVGTGGTISGCSRYFKNECGRNVLTVAVEPESSPVITQTLAGEPLVPAPHKIQGIGAGFVPANLDLSIIDRVELVSDDDAIEYARRLAKLEGLLCGISCGAAVRVAERLAQEDAAQGKTIVVILPDAGERYLSTVLFDGIG